MPFHSSDGCLCVYRRRRLLISLAFYRARPFCSLLSSFPLSLWHSSLPCFILCGMRNNMKLMTFASMRFDMWQQAAFQLAVVRQTDRRTGGQTDRRTDGRIVIHSFVWLQNVDNSTNEVRLPFSGWSTGQSFAHLFTLTNKFSKSGKGEEDGGVRV